MRTETGTRGGTIKGSRGRDVGAAGGEKRLHWRRPRQQVALNPSVEHPLERCDMWTQWTMPSEVSKSRISFLGVELSLHRNARGRAMLVAVAFRAAVALVAG